MTAQPFDILSQPDALEKIDRSLLAELLARFKSLLAPAHLFLLDPKLPPAEFFPGLRNLLSKPEELPFPLRNALAAIERLAHPDSRAELDDARFRSPLFLCIDAAHPPFQQALNLWLHKPFPASPAAQEPAHSRTQTVESSPAASPASLDPPAIATAPSQTDPSAVPIPKSDLSAIPLQKADLCTEEADLSAVAPAKAEAQQISNPRLSVRILLYELEKDLYQDFLRCFEDELRLKYPELPRPALGEDDDYRDAVLTLLTSFDALPPRMRDALLAVQELTEPKNAGLFAGLLARSGIQPDPSTPPEQLAIALWLRRPFSADHFDFLRAQLASAPVPQPAAAAAAPPASAPGPADLAALARFPRHKITHLPPELRESINRMLRQRVTYANIIKALGPQGQGLNKSNLARWKKTGYLLWLAEQQRREDAQGQLQFLFDLVRENENGKIHEATQQIAALRISQVLAAFDPPTLVQALQQQPQSFVRLIQTLPTLSRGGMDCERLLLEHAERKAALDNKGKPKKRGLSESTRRYVEEKLNLC